MHESLPPVFFDRFREVLLANGGSAARSPNTSIASDGKDELFYVPFEHVNRRARLVIVGITPGPNQIELSYEAAREKLKAGLPTGRILEEIKRLGAARNIGCPSCCLS